MIGKDRLKEIRETARTDLYYFQKGIWGDPDLDPEFHGPLCRFLEAPGYRKLLCAFRGSLKSSSIRAWIVWMGLYTMDWSCLLIEMRDENAGEHHRMLQEKFLYGPQAALLQDLYGHRLRINRWNSERTYLVQEDPNAHPFLRHAGLTSRLEGIHVNAIVGDDLEGADAEAGTAPNAASARFVFNRAVPLLISPSECHILISGTPHGPDPLVWQMRDVAEEQEAQNPGHPLNWRYFWREVVDSSGEPRWPSRFDAGFVRTLQIAATMGREQRELFDKQYMLRRSSLGGGFFDMEKIEQNFYKIEHGRLLVYPTYDVVEDEVDDHGYPILKPKMATADLAYCWFYIHIDPLHKDPSTRLTKGESEWAIVVVAVSPDLHAFVIDCWLEDATFDEAIRKFFMFYRRYQPVKNTVESIGAQTWIQHYLKIMERTDYRGTTSLRTPWSDGNKRLAAPSRRTEEALKANKEKEGWILEQLEPWHNMGWLHLHPKFEKLLAQHRNVGTGAGLMDGPDALAQGPPVWKAPASAQAKEAARKRNRLLRALQFVEPVTGYRRPWRDERSDSVLHS